MNKHWILLTSLLFASSIAYAQNFDPSCLSAGVDEDNLLFNGDFENNPNPGGTPSNWIPFLSPPVLVEGDPITTTDGSEIPNHFVNLVEGSQMIQTPRQDPLLSNRFRISICADVTDGQIIITAGDRVVMRFPEIAGTIAGSPTSDPFVADFANSSNRDNIWIRFEGNGQAFIDNIQLFPTTDGDGNEPTPVPTAIVNTPTPPPESTPANTPTPQPPLAPGTPTPTPTPQLSSQSLRIVPNPPMIVVSPDDFANRGGITSQIELKLDVVGVDGKPIEILDLDPDAQIEFRIDARGETQNVGVIRGFEPGTTNNNTIDNQQRDLSEFIDGGEFTLYFVPQKSYDGIVRIIADLDFEGRGNQGQVLRKELRAVVPIVMRTDPTASLTNVSGTFNPATNFRMGRQPGDRGFRPDVSTNLYFRERVEQ